MPTLSQQVWATVWGSRAWTLQEALLSRRCIYISDHQMYFECNAMQCSESLNDARSWVHQTYRDAEFLKNGHSEPSIGAGVLRSPFVGESDVNDRLMQYSVLSRLYSFRDMTDPKDALNAFQGIIQYLTEVEYSKGFFQGLPLEDLNWALLWNASWPPERRSGFPTWSWTGWFVTLIPTYPSNITNSHFFHVPLKIWKFEPKQEQLVQILSLPGEIDNNINKVEDIAEKHPFVGLMQPDSIDVDFDLGTFSADDTRNYLFIEGIVLQFVVDYSRPRRHVRDYGEREDFDMPVAGVNCLFQIMSTDPMIQDIPQETPEVFLLLARDEDSSHLYFHLLVLNQEESIATRKSVITIVVPTDHSEVLHHLGMQRRRIVLG